MSVVDAIMIGRNEGARIEASLASLKGQARRIIFVDSGSTDDSVAKARAAGVEVVELDNSIPHSAARARNAGFAAAMAHDTPPDYVQFIDGDCQTVAGWVAKGAAFLDANPGHYLVTGWTREINRDASIYNQMCDVEWLRPAGPIQACSGNMMVRASAFEQIGGFNMAVIAAEDDDLCVRLAKAGGKLERIPEDMTRHDAATYKFSQWWRRAERTGHGFGQVGHLHPDYFVRERQRMLIYALAVPLATLVLLALIGWPALLLLLIYPLNWWRTAKGLMAEGLPASEARRHAVLLTISKFPNLQGYLRFHLRRLTGADMRLIEYK